MKRGEVGPQRRRATSGALLHCCCICKRLDVWTACDWSYYASVAEMEDGTPYPKFCSSACKRKGGRDAQAVTEQMKAEARAMEWREPERHYETPTPRQRYADALWDQKKARLRAPLDDDLPPDAA